MDSFTDSLRKVDTSHRLPLYRQVQSVLRDAVANSTLQSNDALPPERELASGFGVSRITVRKAIEGLVNEGVLTTHHGSGTYVRSKVEKNFSQLNSFSEEMLARGMKPSSVWLSRSIGRVSPEEALRLRASPGTGIYRFNRIRMADDSPMSIEYSIILASCLPSPEAVQHSLYAALEKTGNQPTRALQRLSALLLNSEQAELLGAEEKDAGLLVERIGFIDDGTAIELSRSYYRGDTYDFVSELTSTESL